MKYQLFSLMRHKYNNFICCYECSIEDGFNYLLGDTNISG